MYSPSTFLDSLCTRIDSLRAQKDSLGASCIHAYLFGILMDSLCTLLGIHLVPNWFQFLPLAEVHIMTGWIHFMPI